MNKNLTTFKPHHIIAASFNKIPSASEVTLISYMLKVAKLSTIEPEKTLLLSSGEGNADSTADKSLFETVVQSTTQPKAPTDKKSKKKKIPSSSEPKISHYIRHRKSKKQFAPGTDTLMFITPDVDPENYRLGKDLQHPVHESQTLRVDELHSASGVTELQNKRVPKNMKLRLLRMRDPLAIDSRIRSLGNVDLDQVIRYQKNDDVEITFIGATAFYQVMEEADFDVESMHDDEIPSISRDDNEEDDSDRELSVANEKASDHVIDEILTEVNQKDTHTIVFAITPNEALVQQLPNLLTATIKKTLPQTLTQAVRDTFLGFNRRIRNAIKDEITKFLNTSVLKPMYKEFNTLNKLETQRFVIVDKPLHKLVHKIVGKSIRKHINNKLGEVNGLLRDIWVVNDKHLQTKVDRLSVDLHELVGLVSKVLNLIDTSAPYANVAVEGEKESQSQPETTTINIQTTEVPAPAQRESQTTNALVVQISSALVVHSTTEEPPIDNIPYEQLSANLFSSGSFQYTSIPPQRTNKGKGIAQTFNDDVLKKIMLYMEEGGSSPNLSSLNHLRTAEGKLRTLTPAQLKEHEQELAEIEAQRIQHLNKMRDEYMHCINFRDNPLPITKFNYRVNKASKIAIMRITRNNKPLKYKIFDDSRLKMLGFIE
ncbi:hypothetical protein Tco_1406218 [Tanacetum coccineum]